MNRLVFTPLAEADLHEILNYIAGHRPLTAVAVVTRIRDKCDLLASHPLIGQQRPEFSGDSFWLAALASAVDTSSVLVLYNQASADGLAIAQYYQQAHPGIQSVQLVGITGIGTSEDITADSYLSILRPQVLSHVTPSTQAIVTTKGLPLRVTVTEPPPPPNPQSQYPTLPFYTDPGGQPHNVLWWHSYSSLESELTNIKTVSTWEMMGDQSYAIPGHFANNPYYHATGSFNPTTYNMLLTSRLDGYTVGDVTSAINRAQNAFIGPRNSTQGPYRFLVDNDPTKTYAPTMANLVANVLTPAGMPVTYDNTSAYIGTAPGPVIGYDSHGGNQESTPPNYTNGALAITPANGAVFNTWENFNAYSFTAGAYTGDQGEVAQWLAMGGTAAVGNVLEPGGSTNRVANEDQLFQMLLDGRTWGKAAWSSFRELGFVNTVVGDPLMKWRVLLPGDFTKDGRVDISDLAILGARWGTTVGSGGFGWQFGDANSDGFVDISDLAIVGAHWGEVSSWATGSASTMGEAPVIWANCYGQ